MRKRHTDTGRQTDRQTVVTSITPLQYMGVGKVKAVKIGKAEMWKRCQTNRQFGPIETVISTAEAQSRMKSCDRQ